jgi:hypothetical protein
MLAIAYLVCDAITLGEINSAAPFWNGGFGEARGEARERELGGGQKEQILEEPPPSGVEALMAHVFVKTQYEMKWQSMMPNKNHRRAR